METRTDEGRRLRLLTSIVEKARRSGASSLSASELRDLPRLYRFASSLLARAETEGDDARTLERLRPLVVQAHGLLHRGLEGAPAPLLRRLFALYRVDVPRAIRAEWKLILATLALIYGAALLAFFAVRSDLGLAYSFMSPGTVDNEIAQLRETGEGEPFRGNFTFGRGESPGTAGLILGNNLQVALLFFASALVPPLYLLVLGLNGLMLGTYTAVAAHWDQAGAISSILWCHGAIEIQAFALAGTAGMILLRAWIAPGPWTRAHAMRVESRRAWLLLAPVFPLLVVAGLIEGFVSPHAPFSVRVAVAVASGAALVAWALASGHSVPHSPRRSRRRSVPEPSHPAGAAQTTGRAVRRP